jgi:hypothetical protein
LNGDYFKQKWMQFARTVKALEHASIVEHLQQGEGEDENKDERIERIKSWRQQSLSECWESHPTEWMRFTRDLCECQVRGEASLVWRTFLQAYCEGLQ